MSMLMQCRGLFVSNASQSPRHSYSSSRAMRNLGTSITPSKSLLRFLRAQSQASDRSDPVQSLRALRQCADSSTVASKTSRRFFSISPQCKAKQQQSLRDERWPRYCDPSLKALPAPRNPHIQSHPRHASTDASGWWSRLRRQAPMTGPKPKPPEPLLSGSYDETSAQLFNLSRALSRNASGADLKLRCTEFDAQGSVTLVSGEFKKSELIAKYGLQPRDLRKIDSSILPHILVRPQAILINLLHLRVLIQSDRVLVFDAYGSTDSYTQSLFMYDLEGKLRQKPDPNKSNSNTYLPYEFRALEAVLISVTSGLEAEFALVRDPVTHILRELEEDIDREKLRHLLIHSKRLGTFEQKARLVRDAIDDLLEADDDLAAMYLTERKQTGKLRPENDHQEVEMLLESYHKICDEIVEISGNLISNIRNTEEVVKAILDANRNQLMLLEIKFSIGTLGLAGGTLIAGLYGMNLNNFIEETEWGFGAVTSVCFVLSAVIAMYGMRKLRKVQKVRMWGEGLDLDTFQGGRMSRKWQREKEAWLERQSSWDKARKWQALGSGGGGSGAGGGKGQGYEASKGGVMWPMGNEGLGMHQWSQTAAAARGFDGHGVEGGDGRRDGTVDTNSDTDDMRDPSDANQMTDVDPREEWRWKEEQHREKEKDLKMRQRGGQREQK